jgi:predicted metal-dependent hydrolase
MIKIDSLIRSKRRTLMLQINDVGELIVRAPMKMPMHEIEKFIEQKSRWIIAKQQQAQNHIAANPKKQFVDGEKFLYLGQPYSLKITTNSEIQLAESLELPTIMLPRAAEHLLAWYKCEAKKIFNDRVEFHSQISGLKHNGIRISNARARWGSCTAKNKLNFTWRLIMAPLEVIDYVIVHELAHISEKNHGKHFWNLVTKWFPHHKASRLWLRKYGELLTW